MRDQRCVHYASRQQEQHSQAEGNSKFPICFGEGKATMDDNPAVARVPLHFLSVLWTNETPNKGIQSDGTWFKCEERGTHDGGFAPRSSAPQPTWGSLFPASSARGARSRSSARGAPRPIIGRTSRGPWVEPDHPIAKAASAPVPMGSQPRDGGLAPPPTLSEDSRQGNISAMRKAFNHHHHQGIQPHA